MTSAGFTLVETLIAMVLTMMLAGTAMALVMPASRASMVQPAQADVQQRARVAAETIAREAGMAGAGLVALPAAVGPSLGVPAVMPRRLGGLRGDGPDVARSSALTLLSVPAGAAATTTAVAISAAAMQLTVTNAPACGAAVLCGFAAGQDVLVTDGSGHFDVFRITRVAGGVGTLRLHGSDLVGAYPAGATVVPVVSRTFERDAVSQQLRQYDGDQSDQPSVDGIADLVFSYFDADGAPLPLSQFADGPWRGAGTTRFDEDLLRVRMIRCSVRAQATEASLRARVPAIGVSLDVAPRSLGGAR